LSASTCDLSKCQSANAAFAAKFLNDGFAVHCRFDAVLGAGFGLHPLDN
jgi:hypothetical protein